MAGGGGADGARMVGAGRRDGAPSGFEKRPAHRVIGDAHRKGVEAAAGEERDRVARPSRQHQGQGARPEGARQGAGTLVKDDDAGRCLRLGEMHDQGIEIRPVLGREDGGDGAVAGGVGPQPVDGFGREGDECAGTDQGRCLGNGLVRGRVDLGGLVGHREMGSEERAATDVTALLSLILLLARTIRGHDPALQSPQGIAAAKARRENRPATYREPFLGASNTRISVRPKGPIVKPLRCRILARWRRNAGSRSPPFRNANPRL